MFDIETAILFPMIVIATEFIPVLPLNIVSTMVMWEAAIEGILFGILVKGNFRKAWTAAEKKVNKRFKMALDS